jgi:hypothetical protein
MGGLSMCRSFFAIVEIMRSTGLAPPATGLSPARRYVLSWARQNKKNVYRRISKMSDRDLLGF